MMLSFTKTFSYLFAILGILFIPFPFNFFPYQTTISDFIFGKLIDVISIHIFGIAHTYKELSSDSSSLYLLALLLFSISTILSAYLSINKKWKKHQHKIYAILLLIISYYLALQLLNYGVDKLFKAQFYLPEPNILYTPFGQLDKDILYWSTMGTSYNYNLIMGAIEVLAVVLLLIKRCRTIGLLLSFGILTNIVAINFSFDISVKLYAVFLLMLTVIVLSPNFVRLYKFFVLNKTTRLNSNKVELKVIHRYVLKGIVILLIAFEALYPYIINNNFNDDNAPRPFLHGAYAIEEQSEVPFKRFFIHRDGYLIFQDKNDQLIDYKLTINKTHFIITDYSLNQQELAYRYSENDSILKLTYALEGEKHELKAKKLDWKSLPALKNQFHWTVD